MIQVYTIYLSYCNPLTEGWLFATLHGVALPKKKTAVLNLRNMPRDLVGSLKAAAGLAHKPLKHYLIEILTKHVAHLRRRGILPKDRK